MPFQIARPVLHRPLGPYSGGAPLRPLGVPLPPPPPPPLNITTRVFPLGLTLTALLWSFVLGFAVGYLLDELLIKPWLASLLPRDLRTVPPLGELEPINHGGANSPVPPSMEPVAAPLWWPSGSIADAGLTTIGHSVTATYMSGNGIPFTSTLQRINDVQDLRLIDVVSDGNSYQMYNVKANGERILIDQLSGSSVSNVTVSGVTVGPKIEGAPSMPYPAFAPNRPNPAARPGGFVPSPQEMPRLAPRRPNILPQPVQAPEPVTAPETLPTRIPAAPTLPSRPAIPGTIPNRTPSPQPPANPAITPRPVIAPIPLLPNGDPAPDTAAPPQSWPPNLEVPWPSADPIGQTASQPRPDLASIARELGRQEQKLAQLGAGKGGPDLEGLLKQIADLLTDQPAYSFPAGGYQLAPICDRDAEGNLLDPLESNWPAGSGELAELRHKVDALAELIQFAKIWKQPICPPERSAPMGAPVTVTFEEVHQEG